MKKIISILIMVIFIFICSISFYNVVYNSKTINSRNIYFSVKDNDSLEEVSLKLDKKGIIKSSGFLLLYAKIKGINTIKPGFYIISPKMKLTDFLNKIQSGKSDYAIITIPEGYTLYQIAARLEKHGLSDIDSILNTKLSEVNFDKEAEASPNVYYELEGYLFPDTYYIPINTDKNKIIQKMTNEFEEVFNDEYKRRAKQMGMSMNQIVTVASLIEKEAANDVEKNRIAGVIYNRIDRNMPLQIDASVIYAITKGQKHMNRVYYKNLKFSSKYNTYINKGLPPGPIASPGKASIEAALYPEKHNYLYYVLDKGKHVFSETYSEHEQNIKRIHTNKQ